MLVRLKKLGRLDDKQLAQKLGKSLSYVIQKLAIMKYDERLKEALQSGLITFSVSRELARIKSETLLREYLRHAVRGGATPGLVKDWVDEIIRQDKLRKGLIDDVKKEKIGLQVPGAMFVCYLCGKPTDLASSQLYRIDHTCLKAAEEGGQV